jgi:hypothetical protein
MSLRVRCIYYDTVYLATSEDLKAFNEDLKHLLANGYSLSLEVNATNDKPKDSEQEVHYKPPFNTKPNFYLDSIGSTSS